MDFEQVKETVTEPTQETVLEPVKEDVVEHIEEAATETVKEVVSEPVEEAIADPVEQTVVEPVKKAAELECLTTDAKEEDPSVKEETLNTSNAVLETAGKEVVDDVPVGAGYNLDFLDDPNYNPFATKSSGIRNSFGTSQPPTEVEEEIVANSAPDNAHPAAPKR